MPEEKTNSSSTRFRRLLRLQEGGLVIVVLVLGLLLTIFGGSVNVPVLKKTEDGKVSRVFTTDADGNRRPVFEEKNKFLRSENLVQLAKDTSFIAIMAVGATLIIIAGGIDISVGSVFALASILGAMFFSSWGPDGAHAGVSPWFSVPLGVLVCLAVGTLCGTANGFMVILLRVHPLIITLGTMQIFRGIAFVITKGQSITVSGPIRDIVRWEIGDSLSVVPLAVMLVVAAIGAVYLTYTVFGRRIYAIGGNETASRYSGVRVNRVKLGVYAVGGLVAGLAALLSIGYYGGASSADGQGYELKVIAAAVVGGASLSGGRGTAFGALLGALIIQMIDSGIVILGIDQNYSQIIIGAVIVLAVALDQFNRWLAQRSFLISTAKN